MTRRRPSPEPLALPAVTARAWGPPPGQETGAPRLDPDRTPIKPGHALAADLRPALPHYRHLVRALACNPGGRLALALALFRHRLMIKHGPAAWQRGLRFAALRLARGEPLVGCWLVARPKAAKGFWQPEETTGCQAGDFMAVTLPVIWRHPRDLICEEILALDPADRCAWYPLTGGVMALGESALSAVPHHPDTGPGDHALRLYRWPLDWLQAGGESSGAACLLDYGGQDSLAEHVLLGERPLVALGRDPAEALEFGEFLKRRQAALRPRLPKIQVQATGRPS